MRKQFLAVLTLAVLCVALLSGGSAWGQVFDQGHFFSAHAAKRADRAIFAMAQRYGRDLEVATYGQMPAALRSYKPKNLGKFFKRWARVLGKKDHLNGVVVLICRKPGFFQIRANKATNARGFSRADRTALHAKLLADFNRKHFDRGLREIVRSVRRAYKAHGLTAATGQIRPLAQAGAFPTAGGANKGADAPAQSSMMQKHGFLLHGWLGSLCCCGLPLVVLGLLFYFVMRQFRGRGRGPGNNGGVPPAGAGPGSTPYAGPGMAGYGSGGAGSFGTGLLGGALGSVLGGWMFNRMENPAAAAPVIPATTGTNAAANTGGGTVDDANDQNASDWPSSDAGSASESATGPAGGSDASANASTATDDSGGSFGNASADDASDAAVGDNATDDSGGSFGDDSGSDDTGTDDSSGDDDGDDSAGDDGADDSGGDDGGDDDDDSGGSF